MRILVLNYEFPPLGGGASPVSFEIAKGYVERGHSVDVVTMGFKGLPAQENVSGVNIYRVPCLRSKKEICQTYEMATYIASAVVFLEFHLKRNTYDFCHTHFIIPTGPVALWAKKRFGLEYIITAHGSDVPGYNTDRFQKEHQYTKPALRAICNQANHVVSPSNHLRALIQKNIGYNKWLSKIPNGIDINKFTPQKKKNYILSTGRLLPRKGFQYLIEALRDEDYGYEIHIAGDGPMMPELKALAAKSKTKVIFHGWLDNNSPEYKNLLEHAAIYALVSEKENASIALLEAMSAGCAVITSNVSGCPETVGDTGIVIEPKNSRLLRKVITEIADTTKIGRLSRQYVVDRYDWNAIIGCYLALLEG